MAFADPVTLTVATVAKTLPRVFVNGSDSRYRFDDGAGNIFGIEVGHTANKQRVSHLLKVSQQKTAADVYTPDTNDIFQMSAHVVLNVPLVGFTATEQLNLVKALNDFVSAGTYGTTTKWIGGES